MTEISGIILRQSQLMLYHVISIILEIPQVTQEQI